MKEIVADRELVAYCGLYCGACGAYLKGRCPGCAKADTRSWCKLRTCCIDAGFSSCADCKTFPDPQACRKFNNLIAKFFGVVFRSDRRACVMQIKQAGLQAHAEKMAAARMPTIKR